VKGVALALLVCLVGAAGRARAADLPAWAREALNAAPPDVQAPATVLLDEIAVTVNGGRTIATHRFVVRVRDLAGRGAAVLREVYLSDEGRIADAHAWLQSPGGQLRQLGGKDAIDVALVGNDVYNEVRVRGFDATRDIEAGAVFAAEIVSEERVLFAQFEWPLQDRWPIARLRRALTLPAGWTARGVTFNGAAIEPTVRGSTYTWEAAGLPAVVDEPFAPPASQFVPRLAVSYFAPDGSRAAGQFADWSEVATWMASMSDASSDGAYVITRTAREVTAGAVTDLDKIRAIARFVQRIQYVSIQTGVGRGGGYRPHPAALVLDKRYGDCKDKAALMRAMLAAVGVRAYLVAIYAGDAGYVRSEWPSPQQFNHCIIAIALAQPAPGAAILAHGTLGPLLIFDPTSEHTAVGDLPVDEQGSFALLQVPNGTLERMPTAEASGGQIERRVTAAVDASGALTATIENRTSGAEAAWLRARISASSAAGFDQHLQRVAAAISPGAVLADSHTADDRIADRFTLTMEVRSARHGQLMQGRLMLVRLPSTLASDVMAIPPGARRHPIAIGPSSVEETITLQCPEGLTLDELPAPVTLQEPWGRFELSVERQGANTIVARRRLGLRRFLVAVGDVDKARVFFERVRSAAGEPIVLAKAAR
jgi:hypothetical protein